MSTFRNRLLLTFVVAWVAYALTYFLRKPLGVVSNELSFIRYYLTFSFLQRSKLISRMI